MPIDALSREEQDLIEAQGVVVGSTVNMNPVFGVGGAESAIPKSDEAERVKVPTTTSEGGTASASALPAESISIYGECVGSDGACCSSAFRYFMFNEFQSGDHSVAQLISAGVVDQVSL